MSNIEFSVVIPVRNGANYIRAAIESILSQSYPYYRIVILENTSTDATMDIIRELASDRITVVPAQTSLSIEQNWGRIVEQPLSEYCTFMGHDDILHPDFLADMAALIAVEPEAGLYQVQIEEIDDDGKHVRDQPQIHYREIADQFLDAVMNGREEVVGTGYVMRSEDYKRVGGIPTFPGLLYADVVLWYRLANLSFKVCSPKTLASYRVHRQSMHRSSNFSRYYLATCRFYEFLLTDAFKNDPKAAYIHADRLLQNNYRTAVSQALNLPDKGLPELQKTKQQILEDGIFTLHDPVARIYEMFIALPSWLRQLALMPINGRRIVRRFFANH